eukprot:s352_g2.t1
MRRPEIQACRGICASGAFAAVLGDGCVVSRGPALRGGDNSPVRNQLHDVQQIQGASGAFAAILAAGSVVTWGEPGAGGDSSSVQHQLKTVQQMQASSGAFAAILVRRDMGGFLAFAAILGDGCVATWGPGCCGGDSSAVRAQLKHVHQIQASGSAFAAILGDGTVVTWGPASGGGDSSAVQHLLKNVQQVQASQNAFAAILGDGSVVTWGDMGAGGDSSAVQHQLKDVKHVQVSEKAFAAILGDGSVSTWGCPYFAGDSRAVQAQLKNVHQIQASGSAFAAILGDGAVVTWGPASGGGDSSSVQHLLKNVQQVQASQNAFAAILGDGSVVTWGDMGAGGDSSAVQHQLKDVKHVQASEKAFAAILDDGSLASALAASLPPWLPFLSLAAFLSLPLSEDPALSGRLSSAAAVVARRFLSGKDPAELLGGAGDWLPEESFSDELLAGMLWAFAARAMPPECPAAAEIAPFGLFLGRCRLSQDPALLQLLDRALPRSVSLLCWREEDYLHPPEGAGCPAGVAQALGLPPSAEPDMQRSWPRYFASPTFDRR